MERKFGQRIRTTIALVIQIKGAARLGQGRIQEVLMWDLSKVMFYILMSKLKESDGTRQT